MSVSRSFVAVVAGSSSSTIPIAATHHLGERPVRNALSVRQAATSVPPDAARRDRRCTCRTPRRAATCRCRRTPDDRDESGAPLVRGGVEQILDQAKLGIAADERRLQADRSPLAADCRDDSYRTPQTFWLGLALQRMLADVLVGDRGLGRASGRFADEDYTGLCDRLDAGRRVHEIAGDHPLSFGAERHCRLAREDTRPRLKARVELRHADTRSSAARTARSASSSCAIGAPQTAMTASPMNFSTVPP